MQTIYQKMETTELDAAIEALKAEVAEVKAKGLALDMARGKPSPSQVDISRPMLDILNADANLHDGNVDCSNYGCFEGIPSARKLAGEFMITVDAALTNALPWVSLDKCRSGSSRQMRSFQDMGASMAL